VSPGTSITAEPPAIPGVPPDAGPGRWRRYSVAAAFLVPAFVVLSLWIVYPAVYTIVQSFFKGQGFGHWGGIDNYKTLFSDSTLRTAIKNNAIWVAIVPAMITALGLIFAVLTEKIRWSVAFKTVVFMPMAISLFAAGVIWRVMDRQEPQVGTVNAFVKVFHDWWSPPGPLADASPSTDTITGSTSQGFVLKKPVGLGAVGLLGVTAIPPDEVPSGAVQAVVPPTKPKGVVGTVWRDFKPGGGVPGKVEKGELGLPGITVELRDLKGKTVDSTKTDPKGAYGFDDVKSGQYRVAIGPATFAKPFGGTSWLGPKLITPSIIVAYIWVWAGFAMVVIAAGLAAIPRDVLEAARTDGAGEWQVFRRVTVPLLAPVLSVVFITMIINVLKIFDIVLSVAPESTQPDANVIALAMWRTAFTTFDYGLGAAIAVFLFALVVPVLALNVRRFRREV
jgi:alpha-glucoside transport system permease protein